MGVESAGVDWSGVGSVSGSSTDWFGERSSPVRNSEPVGEFANVEPAPNETAVSLADEPVTEALPTLRTPDVSNPDLRITEDEHRAALATIELPPYPLELPPDRLAVARRWVSEVAQLAIGAAIGSFAVLVLLYWVGQAVR